MFEELGKDQPHWSAEREAVDGQNEVQRGGWALYLRAYDWILKELL